MNGAATNQSAINRNLLACGILVMCVASLAGCAGQYRSSDSPKSPTSQALVIGSPPAAGDTWVYEYVDFWRPAERRRVQHTVVGTDNGAVDEVLAMESRAGERRMRFDGRPQFIEYGMGDIALHEFMPYLGSFAALRTGQSWTHIPGMPLMNSIVSWDLNGVAQGLEDVTVQAGTFRALKVELRAWRSALGRRDAAPLTARMSLWYSPEVKRVVLIEFSSWDKRGMAWDRERTELVSFSVR